MSYHQADGDARVISLDQLDGRLLLAMTAIMADAFHFDPMHTWLFPNERQRASRLRHAFEVDVRERLDRSATPVLLGESAIAIWHPPETRSHPRQRPRRRLTPSSFGLPSQHPLRAVKVLRQVTARRPTEPHWYLSHLAVQVGRQRHGLGRRLLAVGVEQAAAEDLGVYLETTNPENLPFFGAAGFGQVGIVRVPGAPPVWLLWRPPRTGSECALVGSAAGPSVRPQRGGVDRSVPVGAGTGDPSDLRC